MYIAYKSAKNSKNFIFEALDKRISHSNSKLFDELWLNRSSPFTVSVYKLRMRTEKILSLRMRIS